MHTSIYKLVGCLLLLLLSQRSDSQEKIIASDNQVWLAFLNQSRITDRWGLWTDLHLRTREEFVKDLSTGIARVGVTYYLTDHTKLTAGYAYINHFPGPGHQNISQPEHRPWQQIQWHSQFPKLRMMQYVRLEERYRRKILNDDALADGYLFNFRLRYNFLMQFPLSEKGFAPGAVSVVINDELHINFGKQILYNTFDQNRFFAGLNFHITDNANVQCGYMHFFQQLALGNQYRSNHILRLFYFQNLDWRKNR